MISCVESNNTYIYKFAITPNFISIIRNHPVVVQFDCFLGQKNIIFWQFSVPEHFICSSYYFQKWPKIVKKVNFGAEKILFFVHFLGQKIADAYRKSMSKLNPITMLLI